MGAEDNRKTIRYQTLAKARIEGAADADVLLKDVSITGCCVESTVFMTIQKDAQYNIEVIPETAAQIGAFELLAEPVWTRASGYSCEAGFSILKSPTGKLFQRYVDYLSWRSATGQSSSSAEE
jgi:hypothetical protein